MADEQHPTRNGHHDVEDSVQKLRSGFDRRKNWGESIDHLYKRIDHRLTELVEQGAEKGRALEEQAEAVVDRYPGQTLALCFAAGVLLGLLVGRRSTED